MSDEQKLEVNVIATNESIQVFYDGDMPPSFETMEQVANLFEAAPELLEACKRWIEDFEDPGGIMNVDDTLVALTEQAIAKAEGKDSAPIEQNTGS